MAPKMKTKASSFWGPGKIIPIIRAKIKQLKKAIF
jgi:hypothetical protein